MHANEEARTNAMWIPRADDRAAWRMVSEAARAEILGSADAYAAQGGYPAVTATQYMAFVRDGSRGAMEAPYFERRMRLISFLLAECLAADGRYLDAVIDGIWCVCEETTWCVSAHNLNGRPLPDADDPVIDLFAAQTAALLSWACYLLEGSLPEQVAHRVHREVSLRVLTPFFARDDFWWMGVVRKDLNNWTPWILSNVLASANIWGQGDLPRAAGARATEMLERWLACIPQDGGIDEGVAYWNMAGGSLLDCLEHLHVNRYDEPKIQNIAAFPLATHIGGPFFVNFADCDARPCLDGERIYTFGERIGHEGLKALGATLAGSEVSVLPRDTPELYRVLCKLFHPLPPPSPPPALNATLSDLQLWLRRHGGLVVAVKGGHNAESHNHNDVGSFIVYADGEPAIVDAGNMVYTARTFNDATRYALWNTRSGNHNVPIIGASEQKAGWAFAARNVHFSENTAEMDIAGAYPKEAGVRSLRRSFRLSDGLVLTDEILLSWPETATWVFLLRHPPEIEGAAARSGKLRIAWDERLEAAYTVYPVQDERMARNFPGALYRLTLTAPATAEHAETFRIC